jgi:pimeloyl-ACP methyl ester carboxylesterase
LTDYDHTVNWYRTREQNHKDELVLLDEGREKLTIPILFLQALQDAALKPELAAGMGQRIPNLTWEKVNAGHWALWEKPEECNAIITRWVEGVVFAGKTKL